MTDTLGSLLETAKKNAAREFLLLSDRPRALTFGEFHESACGLAARLQGMGIARQDRVLALLPNSAEYALLYFACLYLGATVVPVNPALHPRDARFIIEKAKAKLLIVAPETRRLVEGSGPLRWELPPLGDPQYKAPWRPLEGVSPDDLLTIVFTSGTTAFPKAVAHRIGSVLGNARAFNEAMGNGPEDRFLHLFPMSYSGGFFNQLIAPYLAGSSVVMTPGFGPRTALEFWRVPIARHVNALWLSPTIAAALLMADRDAVGRDWCRRHIKKAFIGTAPLHLRVKRDFEEQYGVPLYESYGLSETLLAAALGPRTGAVEGTVGVALPGVSLRVEEDGEVSIKTPHLMAGYWDHDKGAVIPRDPSDWFASGDLGSLSAEGRLSITGRKKDMIIRSGLNVSPIALEDVLLRHEAVAQAAVVGVPDSLKGEDIVAVVRTKPGVDPGEAKASLAAFCKAEFAAASRPSMVLVIDEFPTGATGKVLKNKLRDWAAGELVR